MYSEAKKLHLIEEVLKISNEATLNGLDNFLKKSKKREAKEGTFKDFSGIWSAEEAAQIERTIADGCEKIDPDDWK